MYPSNNNNRAFFSKSQHFLFVYFSMTCKKYGSWYRLTDSVFVLKFIVSKKVYILGAKMDFESINNTIKSIETNLEAIKDQIRIFENQKRLEQEEEKVFETGCHRKLERARMMKEIYSLIASGMSSWEVAENVQCYFSSVWDAYYFITHFLSDERARKKYALHFLVYALAQNGFSNVKISKIAGYSPQRCGQILKKAVF